MSDDGILSTEAYSKLSRSEQDDYVARRCGRDSRFAFFKVVHRMRPDKWATVRLLIEGSGKLFSDYGRSEISVPPNKSLDEDATDEDIREDACLTGHLLIAKNAKFGPEPRLVDWRVVPIEEVLGLEKKVEVLRSQNDELRAEVEGLEDSRQKAQERLNVLTLSAEQKSEELDELGRAAELKSRELDEKIAFYESQGIYVRRLETSGAGATDGVPASAGEEQSSPSDPSTRVPKGFDLLVQQVEHLLAHPKGHRGPVVYNPKDRVVARFLEATLTDQIIVLSGPTGTGKTTLPIRVADAIGAKCHVIAVQPDWTSKIDLFGYQSPVTGRYESTEFLDALIEAQADHDRHGENSPIHFVVLDEMNLARVEYYLASVLSVLGSDDSRPREIRLCQGDRDTRSAIAEAEAASGVDLREAVESADGANKDFWDELRQRFSSSVPPTITIPPNVQLVGTLNMDETTQGLSPKVLDRSWCIEIRVRADGGDGAAAGPAQAEVPEDGLFVTPKALDGFKLGDVSDEIEVVKLACRNSDGRLHLSSRQVSQLKALRGSDASSSSGERSTISFTNGAAPLEFNGPLVDDFVLSKILPELSPTRRIGEEAWEALGAWWDKFAKDLPRSREKLRRMYDKDFQVLDYWKQ